MNSMTAICDAYYEALKQTEEPTAAAILVLASSIEESAPFNRRNAENFGHELAMALKNVLQESTLQVSNS